MWGFLKNYKFLNLHFLIKTTENMEQILHSPFCFGLSESCSALIFQLTVLLKLELFLCFPLLIMGRKITTVISLVLPILY